MDSVTPPSETRLIAAMRVASPEFDMRLRAPPVDKSWYQEETRLLADAARVRVRRTVAALNGHDVEKDASPWLPVPAMLSPELLRDLKRGMLNDKVAPLLFSVLGQDAASVLLGEIAAL